MERIKVDLDSRSYEIIIGQDILGQIGAAVKRLNLTPKILIISNASIAGLYADKIKDSLEQAGFEVKVVTVPEGEKSKSIKEAEFLYNKMLDLRLDRNASILSLSGGVIGDLSGFVAATYMRGIAYVQAPTTLLAQVDSSVGGKTGLNLPRGKNLVGAFYQPRLVYIDTDVLKTLSDDELKAGLAEVVKYGVIRDKKLFEYLEENIDKILKKDPALLEHIIACSCRIKAEVVSEDERESGLRAILNYGHTIGHAIEATSGYGMYKHGQAVAIGMVYAGRIALKLEMISQEELQRQTDLLKKIGLPVELPDMDLTKITEAILLDKKIEADKIRFILPQRIGKVIIHPDISLDLIKEVLSTQNK